ncbi:hypothetical protein FGO68_gene11895 [Halteria grandinella]|uniref:Transmembrane protein n=1 Tax=Halteria grandinella TaxID=5974 RepID=A0A8J8SXM4_HALGN|nr:hypothetical protein FGO68_gene11895 [Halteria grandinella]
MQIELVIFRIYVNCFSKHHAGFFIFFFLFKEHSQQNRTKCYLYRNIFQLLICLSFITSGKQDIYLIIYISIIKILTLQKIHNVLRQLDSEQHFLIYLQSGMTILSKRYKSQKSNYYHIFLYKIWIYSYHLLYYCIKQFFNEKRLIQDTIFYGKEMIISE